MNNGLKGIWEKTKKDLLKDEEIVIGYEDNERGYTEYSEGYGFRENIFKNKILSIIKKPYFEKVFYITTSALLSSNNEEQFLHLLERYLASYFLKKFIKPGEDIYEKKTYFMAYLDLTNNSYFKQKLIIERFDFEKFKNDTLKGNENILIFSLVENIYDIIDKEILNKV